MPIFGLKGRGATAALNFSSSPISIEAEKLIPYVELNEFVQTNSAVLGGIQNFYRLSELVAATENIFTGGVSTGLGNIEVYKGLYKGERTPNSYYLPYLTEQHHNIGQNWQETQGPLPLSQQIQSFMVDAAKIRNPSAGIVYPKAYAGTSETGFTISFVLVNTFMGNDGKTAQRVGQNYNFIRTFISQNLHVQDNVLTITPPCLYQALIPGVRYSPVCVVQSLEILNKGNITPGSAMGLEGTLAEKNIPDAWEVTIQFKDLINESRAIYNEAIRATLGRPVVSIISGTGTT